MRILLIGPQGSGKSTQADLLAKDLNLPRVSTGDIFRQLAAQDSEEGRRLKQTMNAGKLIDDQTTAKLIEETLKKRDYQNGFIMDGYPRNMVQRELFDPKFEKVFYLKVPDEEVINRLLKRGRADDSLEAIKTRLNLYYQQTQPLLDYYKNLGILIEIEGLRSIENIYTKIKKHI